MKSSEPKSRSELRVGPLAVGWIAAPLPAALVGFTIVAAIAGSSPQDGFESLGLGSWGMPITVAASSTLVLPCFFWYLDRSGNSISTVGFRELRWQHALLGFALAAGFLIAVEPMVEWIGDRIGLQPLILPQAPASARQLALAILFVGIAGPITEEVLFRGFLIGYLHPRVKSVAMVYVLGTIAFAIPHLASGGPVAVFQTLLWAPIAIGLYLSLGSIYPSIVFHMSNNLLWIYLLSTTPST